MRGCAHTRNGSGLWGLAWRQFSQPSNSVSRARLCIFKYLNLQPIAPLPPRWGGRLSSDLSALFPGIGRHSLVSPPVRPRLPRVSQQAPDRGICTYASGSDIRLGIGACFLPCQPMQAQLRLRGATLHFYDGTALSRASVMSQFPFPSLQSEHKTCKLSIRSASSGNSRLGRT